MMMVKKTFFFVFLPGLCGDVVKRLESDIEQIEFICTSGARGLVLHDVP